MSNADTDSQRPKRRIAYPAILSLALSIMAVVFTFLDSHMERVYFDILLLDVLWMDLFLVTNFCVGLSFILGLVALVQGCHYPRLWWFALFGMGISTGLVIDFIIMMVLCLIFVGPM